MRLDELNVLRSETRKQVAKKKLRDYFEVMELLAYLIEERIDLAYDLYIESYQFLIKFNTALTTVGNPQNEKYVELFKETYKKVLRRNGVTEDTIDKLDEHITKIAQEVVKTSVNKTPDENEVDRRAVLIAETETNVTKNTEQYLQAIKDGKTKKTWITMRDNRVRDSHIPMEGKTVGIDELFNVNGSLMMHPCDTDYSPNPEEVINCRCVVDYHN